METTNESTHLDYAKSDEQVVGDANPTTTTTSTTTNNTSTTTSNPINTITTNNTTTNNTTTTTTNTTTEKSQKNVHPEDKEEGWIMFLIGRLFYTYLNPLLRIGYVQYLEMDDIDELPAHANCKMHTELFSKTWDHIHKNVKDDVTWNDDKSHTKKKDAKTWSYTFGKMKLWNYKNQFQLWRVIFKMYSFIIFITGIMNMTRVFFLFLTPYILHYMIEHITSGGTTDNQQLTTYLLKGFAYAFVLFFSDFFAALVTHQTYYQYTRMYIYIQISLMANIFRKVLNLSPFDRNKYKSGEIVNLMSVDAQRIGESLIWIHYPSLLVSTIILATFGVSIYCGFIPALAGLFTMTLLFPLSVALAKLQEKIDDLGIKEKDKRVKIMNEILQGIKVVKYFVWESKFYDVVSDIRKKESKYIRGTLVLQALQEFNSQMISLVGSAVTFTVFVLLGGTLTTSLVFSTLTLFNIMIWPLMNIPFGWSAFIQSFVSASRIYEFLTADELPPMSSLIQASQEIPDNTKSKSENIGKEDQLNDSEFDEDISNNPEGDDNGRIKLIENRGTKNNIDDVDDIDDIDTDRMDIEFDQNTSILISNAYFSWNRPQQKTKILREDDRNSRQEGDVAIKLDDNRNSSDLKNINLRINKGQLVCIIGTVGAGKTTLLNALFGDVYRVSGFMKINPKNNSSELHSKKIISFCDQNPWILNATVKENILFGNPYDREKYEQVIEICQLKKDFEMFASGDETEIGENGVNLSGGQKHRISLARACYMDSDILLLDSVLNAVDAFVQKQIFEQCILNAKNYPIMRGKTIIITMHSLQFLSYADVIVVMKDGSILVQGNYEELQLKGFDFSMYVEVREEKAREGKYLSDSEQSSSQSNNAQDDIEQNDEEKMETSLEKETNENKSKITVEEDRTTGTVRFRSVLFYFVGYGIPILLFIIFLEMFSRVNLIGQNIWLSAWASHQFDFSTRTYLLVYIAIGITAAISIFLFNVLFALGSLRTASNIHNKMLRGVLRANMSFFHSNPSGRILNRFAKDQYTIDIELPPNIAFLVMSLFWMIGVIILICIFIPPFLLALPPIFLLYYLYQNYYRKTSRELKRLQSISRSPILSHFSQTIQGTSSIRAFQIHEQFSEENENKIGKYMKILWCILLLNRWLGIRLQFVSSLVVLSSSLLGVFFTAFNIIPIDPSFVALSITYSLTITNIFVWFIRIVTEVESNMTSVERIHHYCDDIEYEAPAKIDNNRPPSEWPENPKIELVNLKVKYRKDLDYVLKGVSCIIHPGEKIGIVGRTGAGKSTFTSALFRLVEPENAASILIDGVDICSIGLDDLRSKMTIIPQDPVIFSGTIRENIDIFNEHPDHVIWEVLRQVNLHNFVQQLPLNMMETVSESGANLSVGQKQLLSMARSILKRSKIIILDELNVDHETDQIIQETIRTEFKDSTCLIIAHRLESIIDADRIMVMHDGQIAEFDTPKNLLNKPSSMFASLLEETGKTHSEHLKAKLMKH